MTIPADEQPTPGGSVIRGRLQALEWVLPLALQRPLLRLFGNRYNPYSEWNRTTRSIFIHVPRTAGSSVALAIRGSRFHRPVSRFAAFDNQSYRQYFKFGFVRNPWDRLLSSYSYLRTKVDNPVPHPDHNWARKHLAQYASFEEFVLDLRYPPTRRRVLSYIHFRPQLDWVALPGSKRVELDFVGRFERLVDDFRMIAERLSIEQALPVINASKHGTYRDAFTPRMRDVAAELYRCDIDAFGYGF